MKVLVTGATGFVGRHVVPALLAGGHDVTAVARDETKARALPWYGKARFIAADVFREFPRVIEASGVPDVLLHLVWPGLPNFKDSFHLEVNLPADLRLLEQAVSMGVPRLIVAGTCLEYGLQNGPLDASTPTRPVTPYALAKDSLRKSLETLQRSKPFGLQWVRLFYMHGEGQYDSALLPQLERAIAEGRETFDMSAGDQLRDYLSIEEVGKFFLKVVDSPAVQGPINCCSGKPISVRELVEQRCALRGSTIRLNRGHYGYPDYEPLAFWGVPTAFDAPAREQPVPGPEAVLEATRREGDLDRMRLIEALQRTEREAARASGLAGRIAEFEATHARLASEASAREAARTQMDAQLQARDALIARKDAELQASATLQAQRTADIARLEGVLAQDGHRLVTRLGAVVERHPTLAAIARLPIRFAHWIMNRF